jgi:phosphoglycerate dehydrogenase-like enzyme
MDRATIFLPGRGLGIVGLGAIGREIAQRARAFGLDVRAVDRDAARIGWVEGVGLLHGPERLPGLLAWADFVVIAAPHTPETERLFDAAMLRNMKPSSYLINIGRGAIVVLDDLVAALQAGRLAGAALDVYEIEPLPAGHPLWSMPNVILTPHTAGYSPRIAGRHLTLLAENVGRFARGEPLQNVVNKAFWY